MSMPDAAAIETGQPQRSWIVAALLTLIAPGSGHIYAGHTRRGLLLVAALFGTHAATFAAVAFAPRSIFDAVVQFAGVIALVFFAIYLFGIVDAVRMARRPGAAPRWYATAGAVLAVWLAVFAVRALMKAI